MGMLLLGGTRLRHLRVLDRDPLFLRFARLQQSVLNIGSPRNC